jgi:glucosamine-6-phosphate deaminase
MAERMETSTRPQPVRQFRADAALVEIFATRDDAGRAAAEDVGREIASRQASAATARLVFAAAPSQDEFLAALVTRPEIDWLRLAAFHMDEYLGIDANHPASFRLYLYKHLFEPCGIDPDRVHMIPAESRESPLRVCLDYEQSMRAKPPDIVCGGIGENGHLAFNDPPVADFLDPVWVKVVRLDDACRAQQVHDGCFARIEDVPTHAFTLTIPALLSASRLSIVVPGPRKAAAVLATLGGPISEACPASVLRTHPGARIYLDRESAIGLVP